jgi:hypothetical protein
MQQRKTAAVPANLSAGFISQTSATAVLLVLVLLPSLVVSRPSTLAAQEDLLTRTAAIGDQSLPAFSAFQDALEASSVPGGVAFAEGCADEPKLVVHPHGTTLRQVLDGIVSAYPYYVHVLHQGKDYSRLRPASAN